MTTFREFSDKFESLIVVAAGREGDARYGAWTAALRETTGKPVWRSSLLWLSRNWRNLTDEQRTRIHATAALLFDT